MLLRQLVLILICLFSYSAFTQEGNRVAINDQLKKHSYFIITKKKDRTGRLVSYKIGSGFKMKGTFGLITAYHVVSHADKIIARNSEGYSVELKIVKFDHDHDVACLLPINLDSRNSNRLRPKDYKFLQKDVGFENDFSVEEILDKELPQEIISYSGAYGDMDRENAPISKFKVKISGIELIEKIRENENLQSDSVVMASLMKNYSRFGDLIILKTNVQPGSSGGAVYAIQNGKIHVFGMVHAGYSKKSKFGNNTFLTPISSFNLVNFKKVNKSSDRWNNPNNILFTKTDFFRETELLSVFEKVSIAKDPIDSLGVGNFNFNTLFNFENKLNAMILSDTLPSNEDWADFREKVYRKDRNYRNQININFLLFKLMDELIYQGGFNDAVVNPNSSIINDFSVRLEQADSKKYRIKRKNQKFFTNYFDERARALITEVEDYRNVYQNSLKLINESSNKEYLIFERMEKLECGQDQCLKMIEKIFVNSNGNSLGPNFREVYESFFNLSKFAEHKKDSLENLIDLQIEESKLFIEDLLAKEKYKEVFALINQIEQSKKYRHIWYGDKKYFQESRLTAKTLWMYYQNRVIRKKTIEELKKKIAIIYHQVYLEHLYENSFSFPMFTADIEIGEGNYFGRNEFIKLDFSHDNKSISIKDGVFVISTFKDFPMGRSKADGLKKGAALTAELLADFLIKVDSLKSPSAFNVDFKTHIHVIGMSDGHNYKGNYNPEIEFGPEAFEKTVDDNPKFRYIKDIHCDDHSGDVITRKRGNLKLLTYKDFKNQHSFGSKSDRNNVQLAFHRADNYWVLIKDELVKRGFYENGRILSSKIYACKVPEKDGRCRRTEISIQFEITENGFRKVEEMADISLDANGQFEELMREFEESIKY